MELAWAMFIAFWIGYLAFGFRLLYWTVLNEAGEYPATDYEWPELWTVIFVGVFWLPILIVVSIYDEIRKRRQRKRRDGPWA